MNVPSSIMPDCLADQRLRGVLPVAAERAVLVQRAACRAQVVKTFLTLGSVHDSLPAISETWKS